MTRALATAAASRRTRVTVSEIGGAYARRRSEYQRAATSILGNSESARDAVNDAFLTAIGSSATYRGEGSLEGWIWSIVINTARDHRRRKRFEMPSDGIRAPMSPSAQAAEAERPADPHALRALISRLPERQRLVVFLRFYADLDYAEIAERLKISVGTVGATLHAALEALNRAGIA